MAFAPLFIPLVMSGLAILILFSTYNIGGPAVRLFVAHVALTVPYIIRMVATSMAGFDWNQEMVARNLGASPLRAFIEIVLPQIMPGVIAGGLFALIVSFDDVGISIFLIGASYTTLPVELFAFATYDLTPMVAAARGRDDPVLGAEHPRHRMVVRRAAHAQRPRRHGAPGGGNLIGIEGMTQRVIHVGIGVFGKRWCTRVPEDQRRRRHDRGRGARRSRSARRSTTAARRSALPDERCFTDARARVRGDARPTSARSSCTPAHHEAIIDLAIAHGVDILCEKPIADTMEASLRIARKVAAAGRKMAVTMSHRFDQDKTTLRRIVRSGVLGTINAIGMPLPGRHAPAHGVELAVPPPACTDPLLIEGAIHHLDIVADLAGARCETLYATTWKPDWAEYAGDTDGIVTMMFENGVRAVYEGSVRNAGRPQHVLQGIHPGRRRARHRDPQPPRGRGVHAPGHLAPAEPRGTRARRSRCSRSRNGSTTG